MPIFVPAFALVAALATRAPPPGGQGAATSARPAGADLQARPVRAAAAAGPSRAQPPAATAACMADVCQPIVSVPGFDPQFARPSRTELLADLLERSHVEPLASIVGALAATGLRVDYVPGFVAGAGPSGRARWGSVSLRLKVRLDPWNEPVFRGRSIER